MPPTTMLSMSTSIQVLDPVGRVDTVTAVDPTTTVKLKPICMVSPRVS